jgi:FkbM family methyltransferase
MVDKIRGNRYENAERELLPRYIDPSLPIIDLGAGIGYTACLADHVTDASLNPVAVEPMPELHPVIRQTARLNDATIDIVHAAYDSEGETTTFFSATDFWSSSRYDRDSKEQTKTTVPSASLSELQERFDLEEEIQLIVDIEGGEHDLLTNELELLAETCSCLIIEFHPFTESTVGEYREMLENSGFEQLDCRDFVYVFSNRSVGPDPTAVV